ncbi:hypothetical protein ACLQ2N_32905 [Streptomyces sp. DT224]|uniref:hypothetical protein n=1 Tax=Streptomyces sp. DT224 TaxID=3393426 RepID=UPI003CEE2094
MPVAALSPAFDNAVTALTAHPAVTEMAQDLLTAPPVMLGLLLTDSGTPTTRFMALANERFTERTGETAPFLGSVARAVQARLTELRAEQERRQEAEAAELEARQALRDMWRHGSPRCPLTRYATASGALADRLTGPTA